MSTLDENVRQPIEASVGNGNRYIHWCDFYRQKRYYGACLDLAERHQRGEIQEGHVMYECAQAIDGRRCSAQILRASELKAGFAVFFASRQFNVRGPAANPGTPGNSRDTESYWRGWNKVRPDGPKRAAKPEAPDRDKSKPVVDLGVQAFDYGALVNDLAKEAVLDNASADAGDGRKGKGEAVVCHSVASESGQEDAEVARGRPQPTYVAVATDPRQQSASVRGQNDEDVSRGLGSGKRRRASAAVPKRPVRSLAEVADSMKRSEASE